jgi:transposase
MLIVGYCYGIRSERQLCEEVRLNLAYRWFCRLSIEDTVPDHSTFSRTRHGGFRESESLRNTGSPARLCCIRPEESKGRFR